MTTKLPARNTVMPLSKARRDLLPSFQQLQQTKNKSSVISTNTNTNDTKVLNPIISPTSTAETTDEDDDGDIFSTTPIVSFARLRQQHQQHGSDSLSQWDGDALYESSYTSVVTPQQIGSLAAMKELDIALDGVACATKNTDDNDDDDDDDHDDHDALYRSNSEANYSIGEETAVTGNMSAFSSSNTPIMGSKCRRVTPRKTPELNLSSCREEEFPEPSTSRRLFMCGAVDVTTEIKGSFQDVNDTFRQILTTVRRFGPDEKDAVKDTLKDAQSFMKQRVLSGILGKNRCGGGAAESHDDEDEESDLRDSPKHRDWDEKMRGRRSRNFTAHGDQTFRGRKVGKAENDDELPQESEEVVYDKSAIEIESSELKDLKVFEC